MSGYHNNSIFWIETEKIKPNPYQPRREFEPKALEDLADSVRQYGVLQPLVVTRKEMPMTDGHGMSVSYELIAGERRLRASKLAGLHQVPVIIRKETDDKVKLELAIIENLQREDLNPIDRALAFEQLYKQFNLTHAEIGKKMGKSRVYVSNSLRLLSLPNAMQEGLTNGRITEGHTRPLLMLSDKPEEQSTLYKEIMLRKMSVRESEKVARKIAQDKVRKKEFIVDPRIRDYEKRLSENLGTRVHIEPKEKGGKIMIDYFTLRDLDSIMSALKKSENTNSHRMMDEFIQNQKTSSNHADIKKEIDVKEAVTDIENTVGVTISDMALHHNVNIVKSDNALPEFHHNQNEEIIPYHEKIKEPVYSNIENKLSEKIESYKNTLPVFTHEENRELDMYKSELSEHTEILDQTEVLDNKDFNKDVSVPINQLNQEFNPNINIDPKAHTDVPIHNYQKQNQNNIPIKPQYTPQTQYNSPELYTGAYHNPNVQHSTPKKKGFLGGLFRS